MRHLIHFAEDGDSSGYFPALAKYHDRQTYRMTFATLRPMAPRLESLMREQGVETYSSRAGGRLLYPLALARLTQYLRANRYDVFHAHLFDAAVVGMTAARLAAVPARILTRHYSNYHTRINRPLHVKLDQWCTALSNHVIAVSNETADHLVRVEGAPAAKVTTIHNGIDFERVRTSGPDARSRIRGELGLGSLFTLLIAGRLHPEKGYEHLFEAIRILRERTERPFVLLIAGDGRLLEKYRDSAKSLGIAKCVRFLGFRTDLPDLMAASDLFVLPSVAEAFGLVLAEALYLGLPILATRVGGIPEVVDDGVDGCLVPPGDPVALSRAMKSFLRGEVHLAGQGAPAIRKVKARFDFEQMLRKYETVYEQVLAGTVGA